MRQRPKSLSQLGVIRSTRTIAYRHPHAADDPARPPPPHTEHRTNMSDSLSLASGRHHFFARRSFSAALSSIASAKSFFSLAFSLSRPRRRFASETSRPPYFAFQL